ncbi:unnamed protein product [Somion occarium]|uniref:Uncharacterized protein n=1 Tax=Somion occarium TaxID=3059160 RepID=A0ABP1DER2_9APHY
MSMHVAVLLDLHRLCSMSGLSTRDARRLVGNEELGYKNPFSIMTDIGSDITIIGKGGLTLLKWYSDGSPKKSAEAGDAALSAGLREVHGKRDIILLDDKKALMKEYRSGHEVGDGLEAKLDRISHYRFHRRIVEKHKLRSEGFSYLNKAEKFRKTAIRTSDQALLRILEDESASVNGVALDNTNELLDESPFDSHFNVNEPGLTDDDRVNELENDIGEALLAAGNVISA